MAWVLEDAPQSKWVVEDTPPAPEGKYGLPAGDPRIRGMDKFMQKSSTGTADANYEAGGKVTDLLTKWGASPNVAAAGGYGTNLALNAIPALFSAGGGAASAKALDPVSPALSQSFMKSAIKPTLADLRSGDAASAITTMLQNGFSPTKSGVAAMQGKIADLADQVKMAIANSTATVNKNAVADYLRGLLDKFSKQVNPGSDTKAIENAWTEFLNHPMLAGKAEIPVQLAQELKQGTYAALGNKSYGELQGASTEAQKQLARGLKDKISEAVPAVSELNALQHELINAKDIAQRRALLEGNKNPLGLALLAKDPMAAIGFLADRSAAFKSMLAHMLYRENIPALAAGTTPGILELKKRAALDQ